MDPDKGPFNGMFGQQEMMDQIEDPGKHFKILFDYAPDTIFLLDMKGRILDTNSVTEELTGYSVKELIGSYITEVNLFSQRHIPKVIKNIAKSALGLSTGPDKYSLHRKDGSPVDVEVRTYPVSIADKTRILGIARDITGRRKIEAELKEKVKDLEGFYEMAVNRELKMKKLKEEIAELREELSKYKGDDGTK